MYLYKKKMEEHIAGEYPEDQNFTRNKMKNWQEKNATAIFEFNLVDGSFC